jgi:hypothetical protein
MLTAFSSASFLYIFNSKYRQQGWMRHREGETKIYKIAKTIDKTLLNYRDAKQGGMVCWK